MGPERVESLNGEVETHTYIGTRILPAAGIWNLGVREYSHLTLISRGIVSFYTTLLRQSQDESVITSN